MSFPAINQKSRAPHVGTTDELGRWGGAHEEEAAAEMSTLVLARKLFADLSCSLDGEIDRLQNAQNFESDVGRIKSLNELIRQNQKALQTVLDMEAKLMHEAKKARPGRDVIDLGEARAEIDRRLARLAE